MHIQTFLRNTIVCYVKIQDLGKIRKLTQGLVSSIVRV